MPIGGAITSSGWAGDGGGGGGPGCRGLTTLLGQRRVSGVAVDHLHSTVVVHDVDTVASQALLAAHLVDRHVDRGVLCT